jgi:hypothetical protein
MKCFRLIPIDLDHRSWKRSKVTKQSVRVLARDCADARAKAMLATYQPEYVPIDFNFPQASPWQLPDVTSCEPGASMPPLPDEVVVADDGTHWPLCF